MQTSESPESPERPESPEDPGELWEPGGVCTRLQVQLRLVGETFRYHFSVTSATDYVNHRLPHNHALSAPKFAQKTKLVALMKYNI